MNYEKKYKEALERAKEEMSKNGLKNDVIAVHLVETIFHELRESEGDKVRKKLIHLVKKSHEQGGYALHKWEADEMIAWLEKQGEKPRYSIGDVLFNKDTQSNYEIIDIRDDMYICDKGFFHISHQDEYELVAKKIDQKPADKVEPKFKKGDWVILTAGGLSATLQIVNVDTNKKLYWFNDNSYLPIVDEECLHHWKIQDAKDGDILARDPWDDYPFPFVAIFRKREVVSSFSTYCHMSAFGKFKKEIDNNHTSYSIHPATKEQRDLLFQKMEESGYKWDAEKKELKLLITNGGDFESETCEPKPAWSEKDESHLTHCVRLVNNAEGCSISEQENAIVWLKSLKQRHVWKPSEEQMEALKTSFLYWKGVTKEVPHTERLESLYEQLKQL